MWTSVNDGVEGWVYGSYFLNERVKGWVYGSFLLRRDTSVQDGISAPRKPICAPSPLSKVFLAFEVVPMFIRLTATLSHLFEEGCCSLLLSTPLCSGQLIATPLALSRGHWRTHSPDPANISCPCYVLGTYSATAEDAGVGTAQVI